MPIPPDDAPLTVLVTGASSGIGRATGLELAGRGAQLVLMSRDRSSLEEAAAEMRAAGAGQVVVCAGDVTDEDQVRAADRVDPDVDTRSDEYHPMTPATGTTAGSATATDPTYDGTVTDENTTVDPAHDQETAARRTDPA